MNALVRDFYGKDKNGKILESCAILSESKESWEEVSKKAPELPRGWYELCRLDVDDRICFTLEFWQKLLPDHPTFHRYLDQFFGSLDDVGVVLKKEQDELFAPEMVYSLQDNSSFFRGLLPADESDLDELKREIGLILPHDYLSFLKIHNGFGKLSELSLLPTQEISAARRRLMEELLHREKPLMQEGRSIDPGSLIPFYESSGFSFQCFFADWYPGSEMGNVYLSGIDYTLSETADRKSWADQMAFSAFLEWLAFYLEGNCLD